MKSRLLSVRTGNEGWLRRVWHSMRLGGAGTFASQIQFAEGYRMPPSPLMELDRVNGKLVLMGRNQTMKMLIRAPQAGTRESQPDIGDR